MAAASPSLNAADAAPPRRGSASASPWQLVEVSKETAASVLSKPNSPNIPLLGTPPTQPRAAPANGDDWEEPLPSAAWDWDGASGGGRRSWWEVSGGDRHEPDDAAPGGAAGAEEEDGGFEPTYFVGDWMDNLGHRIAVAPSGPRGGAPPGRGRKGRRNGRDRDREGPSGNNQLGFLAVLQKPGLPEKKFTIAKDRGGDEWTCGNGRLVRDESGAEVLVWLAGDGRRSQWTRSPPEGPVYFDAPPSVQAFVGQGQPAWLSDAPGDGAAARPHSMYFMMSSEVPPAQGEGPAAWDAPPEVSAEDFPPLGGCPPCAASEPAPPGKSPPAQEVSTAAAAAAAANAAAGGFGTDAWNPAAPEFVPSAPAPAASAAPAAAAAAPPATAPSTLAAAQSIRSRGATPSPLLKPAPPWASPRLMPSTGVAPQPRRCWGRTPTPSPKMGPVPSPKLGPMIGALAALAPAAPKPPIAVQLSGDSPDVTVNGPRLEWCLPESWGKLSKFPKDFCMTSPMFGVRRAASMQLAFYPNGSRTAEDGHCTVALTRGPDSAGIKFEFLVNGRGIGPKVCLGRRYLGDYPTPFDNSEEHEGKSVVVCMQVLEILGE